MGVIQPDYLILELISPTDTEVLDKFIEEEVPKEFKNLFHKTITCINEYCNYYVSWDGSKEGWKDSDKGDKLKTRFIKLAIDNLHHVHVIKIRSMGDNLEKPYVVEQNYWDGKLIERC